MPILVGVHAGGTSEREAYAGRLRAGGSPAAGAQGGERTCHAGVARPKAWHLRLAGLVGVTRPCLGASSTECAVVVTRAHRGWTDRRWVAYGFDAAWTVLADYVTRR